MKYKNEYDWCDCDDWQESLPYININSAFLNFCPYCGKKLRKEVGDETITKEAITASRK